MQHGGNYHENSDHNKVLYHEQTNKHQAECQELFKVSKKLEFELQEWERAGRDRGKERNRNHMFESTLPAPVSDSNAPKNTEINPHTRST